MRRWKRGLSYLTAAGIILSGTVPGNVLATEETQSLPTVEENTTETTLVTEEVPDAVTTTEEPVTQEVNLVTAPGTAVAITEENFPDTYFREYVKKFDLNENDFFEEDELAEITVLDLVDQKTIKDITGAELFPNLTKLFTQNSGIITLDLTKLATVELCSFGGDTFQNFVDDHGRTLSVSKEEGGNYSVEYNKSTGKNTLNAYPATSYEFAGWLINGVDAGKEITHECDMQDGLRISAQFKKKIISEWKKIGNNWYYYVDGKACTGWQKINGYWYYFNTKGVMQTGWQKINGHTYYLYPGGDMATGWRNINNKWYYFVSSGEMQTGWQKINGYWYYLKSNGEMATRWQNINSYWYYLHHPGGNMASGWVQVGKYWYHLKSSGEMETGWKQLNGHWYYLHHPGGNMATGWLNVNGHTYYLNANGEMQTGWRQIGGTWYYFYSGGNMANCGWLKLNNYWYFVANDGAMQTGWVLWNGREYYMDPVSGIWSGQSRLAKVIALTFDDGPGPYTNRLLNILQNNGAKATFFVVGQSLSSYSSTIQRMDAMGMEIGNHTWNHSLLNTVGPSAMYQSFAQTDQKILALTGKESKVFRSPGGNESAVYRAGVAKPLILWSIDTRDWETRNADATVSAVLNNVKDGDIILMHDIHSPTVDACERLIPELRRQGYSLVTVSELAQSRGITMRAGVDYYSMPAR